METGAIICTDMLPSLNFCFVTDLGNNFYSSDILLGVRADQNKLEKYCCAFFIGAGIGFICSVKSIFFAEECYDSRRNVHTRFCFTHQQCYTLCQEIFLCQILQWLVHQPLCCIKIFNEGEFWIDPFCWVILRLLMIFLKELVSS